MRFAQRTLIAAAAALAMLTSASGAMAHGYSNMMFPASRGYSGSWPVTVTHSQFSNGTDCLTLNGGSNGGSASLVAGGQKYPYGSFLVVSGILIANIVEPLYGQNGALMFTAHANRGQIGRGIFEDLRGGSNFDAGDLTFGAKNGC